MKTLNIEKEVEIKKVTVFLQQETVNMHFFIKI